MNNSLGERIRALRKEKNLNQTQLASLISTTQDTVSLWELGKSLPSVNEVIALTQVFGVSSDYLLGLKDY